MPVYRRHRLIHIHIPKTAGTSIAEYVSSRNDMAWNEDSVVGPHVHNGRRYEYQHLTWREFRALFATEFQGFHAFAVLRNPYARLLARFGESTNRINPPPQRNYAKYFERRAIDRVNRIYAQDFELGRYEML